MARRIMIALLALLCTGATTAPRTFPTVPVVLMSDVGPHRLFWSSLPVRRSTFFCLGYPMMRRDKPLSVECLSVNVPTNEVQKTLYTFSYDMVLEI